MELFYQLQLIPIFALIFYLLYYSYYYAAPTIHLRLLLYFARKRHHITEVRITERAITVQVGDRMIERSVDLDLASRFMVTTLCDEVKAIIREVKKEQRLT